MLTTASVNQFASAPQLPERVLLSGVSWETYERLRDDLERAGRRLKLTYDDGELEIEVPGKLHEILKTFVRILLETYLTEQDIPFEPLSATTWKQELRKKGLEADESYYIQSLEDAAERTSRDAEADPVPDLAIEIEVTSPLLPKLPVYAALGVREIWHIRTAEEIIMLRLDGGAYVPILTSEAVPYFSAAVLAKYIALQLSSNTYEARSRFSHDLRMPRLDA